MTAVKHHSWPNIFQQSSTDVWIYILLWNFLQIKLCNILYISYIFVLILKICLRCLLSRCNFINTPLIQSSAARWNSKMRHGKYGKVLTSSTSQTNKNTCIHVMKEMSIPAMQATSMIQNERVIYMHIPKRWSQNTLMVVTARAFYVLRGGFNVPLYFK